MDQASTRDPQLPTLRPAPLQLFPPPLMLQFAPPPLPELGPMRRSRRRAVAALGLALTAALASAAVAAADAPEAVPASAAPTARQTVAMASCVGGPPIAFGPTDSRVVLESDDQTLVHAAVLERYPLLQRDGFAPQRILLWHKGEQWLFVSLASSSDMPQSPCFTATFAADGFAFTRELIQKYFFAGTAPA